MLAVKHCEKEKAARSVKRLTKYRGFETDEPRAEAVEKVGRLPADDSSDSGTDEAPTADAYIVNENECVRILLFHPTTDVNAHDKVSYSKR